VAAGEKTGIPTPANRALTDILNSIVAGDLAWTDYQRQPEKLLAAVED
jgi:hypothetical protein